MGTSSTVTICEDGKPLCTIYQQFDGYIKNGVGEELKAFVKSKPFVNVIADNKNVFTGAGCFAVQFIAEFKNGERGFRITNLCDIQKYNYFVDVIYKKWKCVCMEPSKVVIKCIVYGEEVEEYTEEIIQENI